MRFDEQLLDDEIEKRDEAESKEPSEPSLGQSSDRSTEEGSERKEQRDPTDCQQGACSCAQALHEARCNREAEEEHLQGQRDGQEQSLACPGRKGDAEHKPVHQDVDAGDSNNAQRSLCTLADVFDQEHHRHAERTTDDNRHRGTSVFEIW